MKKLALIGALALAITFGVACGEPAPDDSNEQAWICATYRPYGTGELYDWRKIDSNSLKCWQDYDGCRSYQLDYESDGEWHRRYVVSVPCPVPA